MGVFGSSRITVHAEVASPRGGPGARSAVSEPLDGIASSREELWDCLVDLMLHPETVPHLSKSLQSSELRGESETEYRLVEVHKASAIEQAFLAQKNVEELTITKQISLDKASWTFIMDVEQPGAARCKIFTTVHEGPLRVEQWGIEPGGRADRLDKLENLAQLMVAMVDSVGGHSIVGMRTATPSPDGSGLLSVVSDPLDEHIDIDSLWDKLIQLCHRSPDLTNATDVLACVDNSDTEFTVTERSPANLVRSLHGATVPPRQGFVQTQTKYCIEEIKRKLSSEWFLEDGTLLSKTVIRFHAEPLVLEAWCELPSLGRVATELPALVLRHVLDSILGRGGVSKVGVSPDLPSPTDPELKSALSDALDDFTDHDTLIEQVVALYKGPFFMQGWAKAWQVSEVSASEFVVTITPNGEGAPGDLTRRCCLDRGKSFFTEETSGPDGASMGKSFLMIHKDPLRCEAYREVQGERRSGLQVTAGLQAVIDACIGYRKGRAVRCHDSVPSPSNPEHLSVLSDSLEGLITFDRLWDRMAFVAANQVPAGLVKSVRVREGGSAVEFAVEEVMDGVALDKLGIGSGHGTDVKATTIIQPRKQRGELITEKLGPEGQKLGKHFYKVHQDPLRVEIWREEPQLRRSGQLVAAILRGYLDEVARRCESKKK